ncbi:MAG: hypothetical protein PHU47_03795 [Candidatus ainarchaeum sp.]|nr:hypothetical protein [Candidatus ainarchaeum sp.]
MPGKKIDLKYRNGQYNFSVAPTRTAKRSNSKFALSAENAQKLKLIAQKLKKRRIDNLKQKIFQIDKRLLDAENKMFTLSNNLEKIDTRINIVRKELSRDPKNKKLLQELENLKMQRNYVQIEINSIETISDNLNEKKELANRLISEMNNPKRRNFIRPTKIKKESLMNILEALRILQKEGIISSEEYTKRKAIFIKLQNKIKLTELEKQSLNEQGQDPLFEDFLE